MPPSDSSGMVEARRRGVKAPLKNLTVNTLKAKVGHYSLLVSLLSLRSFFPGLSGFEVPTNSALIRVVLRNSVGRQVQALVIDRQVYLIQFGTPTRILHVDIFSYVISAHRTQGKRSVQREAS